MMVIFIPYYSARRQVVVQPMDMLVSVLVSGLIFRVAIIQCSARQRRVSRLLVSLLSLWRRPATKAC